MIAARRWLVAILAVALVVATPSAGAQAGRGDLTDAFREGEVVVQIDPLSAATIAEINATYGTSVITELADGSRTYLLRVAPGRTTLETIELMEPDLRLAFSEPNVLGKAPEARSHEAFAWAGLDPTPYQESWASAQLGLRDAHLVARGAGVLIAVLDTGVEGAHPALSGALAAGYDFVEEDLIPDDAGNGLDDDGDGAVDEGVGHGTHVAGIVHLVAPDATLLPLRVLDSDGRGSTFAVARAIAHATRNGAAVVNLSLSTESRNGLLESVIRRATLAGVVVTAAAGNLGTRSQNFPAADQCVLGVTAVDSTGVKPPFASFGNWIDYAAPGVEITSAFPRGGYATGRGTSLGTAFVAGQAALLRGLAPTRTPLDIGMLIASTSHSLDATNSTLKGQLGFGRPDVGASVAAALAGAWTRSQSSVMSSSCVE